MMLKRSVKHPGVNIERAEAALRRSLARIESLK